MDSRTITIIIPNDALDVPFGHAQTLGQAIRSKTDDRMWVGNCAEYSVTVEDLDPAASHFTAFTSFCEENKIPYDVWGEPTGYAGSEPYGHTRCYRPDDSYQPIQEINEEMKLSMMEEVHQLFRKYRQSGNLSYLTSADQKMAPYFPRTSMREAADAYTSHREMEQIRHPSDPEQEAMERLQEAYQSLCSVMKEKGKSPREVNAKALSVFQKANNQRHGLEP